MLSPFRLSALMAAFVASHAFASAAQPTQVEQRGTVTDGHGQPVVNAKVHLHGRQQFVFTDKQGQFVLKAPQGAELHIAAKGYEEFVSTVNAAPLSIQLTPAVIERITISAAGLHHYDLDSAHPVTVLADDELMLKSQATLGESLKMEPGVHSNYYGPVASSPVIRGLDGPRVKLLSNSLDTGDVSRIGPDHPITADALTTEQVEILRGPSTLLYGSGAIGGLINIVDNRLPRQIRPSQTKVDARYGSGAQQRELAASYDGGSEHLAWHVDGLDRASHDVSTPNFSDADGDTLTSIGNSGIDTQAFNAGISFIDSDGLVGFSAGRMTNFYGIPGHSHADEADGAPAADEGVFADAAQNRYNLAVERYAPFAGVESMALQAAYTDYGHQEIEDGQVGTQFSAKTLETRWTLEHADIEGWHGIAGIHHSNREFAAQGEEAFTPATDSRSLALFVLEEKKIDRVQLQLGARFEQNRHQVQADDPSSLLPASVRLNASSFSAGAVWALDSDRQLSLQLSRSERTPDAAELYANGVHVATKSYEIGLMYALDEANQVTLVDSSVKAETAHNIDLGFRQSHGDVTYQMNVFYNQIADFVYEQSTGLVAHDLEAEAEGEGEQGHEHDEFHVLQMVQHDVKFTGFEFQLDWQLTAATQLSVFGDKTRATLDNGGYLPRIPPYKLGVQYQYQMNDWAISAGVTRFGQQTQVAATETITAGYNLVDLSATYELDVGDTSAQLYGKLQNAGNTLGFVHSSFLKNEVPLPGRSAEIGVRLQF